MSRHGHEHIRRKRQIKYAVPVLPIPLKLPLGYLGVEFAEGCLLVVLPREVSTHAQKCILVFLWSFEMRRNSLMELLLCHFAPSISYDDRIFGKIAMPE